MKPTISVVIAAYNEEVYIPVTLAAIRNQTHKDFQLIVVDNNSTDTTAHIAKKFGATVIREKQQGYVHALNTGMHRAKGDIIVVTDADTVVPPAWLEQMRSVFDSDPAVAVVAGSLRFNTSSSFINLSVRISYDLFMRFQMGIKKPNVCGGCMAIRRDVFRKINGLNTDFQIGADVGMGIAALKHGKVIYVPGIWVVTSHRRWKKSMHKQFISYARAYINVVWKNKPVKQAQNAIR